MDFNLARRDKSLDNYDCFQYNIIKTFFETYKKYKMAMKHWLETKSNNKSWLQYFLITGILLTLSIVTICVAYNTKEDNVHYKFGKVHGEHEHSPDGPDHMSSERVENFETAQNPIEPNQIGTVLTKNNIQINSHISYGGNQLLKYFLNEENYEKLKSHGCWCQKFSQNFADIYDERLHVGGFSLEAIDELDKICRAWFKASRCIQKITHGSCNKKLTKATNQKNSSEISQASETSEAIKTLLYNDQNDFDTNDPFTIDATVTTDQDYQIIGTDIDCRRNDGDQCHKDLCETYSHFAGEIGKFFKLHGDFGKGDFEAVKKCQEVEDILSIKGWGVTGIYFY